MHVTYKYVTVSGKRNQLRVPFVSYVIFLQLDLIVGATHRFYESRRQLFNDSRPQRRAAVQQTKKSLKRKELRKRVYHGLIRFELSSLFSAISSFILGGSV